MHLLRSAGSLKKSRTAWPYRVHNLAAAMLLQPLHQAIWYLSPALQTILLWVLTSRKLYRDYPFFYLYTFSHIARSLLSDVILKNSAPPYHAYIYFYRITEAYFAVLCLAVVQELYKAAFADLPRLRRFYLLVFQIATAVLVISCLVSGYLSPGTDQARGLAALVVLQRSLDLLVGGLSFALLAALRVIGLSWQTRSAGIALGFTVNSAIALAAASARSLGNGPLAHGIYAVSLATAYALALIIWNVSVLRLLPEAHTPVSAKGAEAVGNWKRWLEGVGL
jgi:hypothetical protein